MKQQSHPLGAQALSIFLQGLEARVVRVRAEITTSASPLQLVGMPEAQGRETRVRLRGALQQLGVEIPAQGIVLTFEPGDLAPDAACDLAFAIALLVALGRLPAPAAPQVALVGELSLTGQLRPVRGVLPRLQGATKLGISTVIVPRDNAGEAALVGGLQVFVAEHLREVIDHLQGVKPLTSAAPPQVASTTRMPDLAELRCLEGARRALEIAAAGAHDLLLLGPPGTANTLLARRLPSILPPMTREEVLEVTSVYSVAGLLARHASLSTTRPFRAPHFTVSSAGLLGGGEPARPGEVSLAHQGVLFLDELHDFRRSNLEALDCVLDEGQATICRGQARVVFPAKALVVGATIPCPCGFMGIDSSRCSCSPERIMAHQERLTGPFFERFHLRLVMPLIESPQLQSQPQSETSSLVQERVVRARARQQVRGQVNARLSNEELERFAIVDLSALSLSQIEQACVRRVARTIADLDVSDLIRAPHLAEALQFTTHPCPRRSR